MPNSPKTMCCMSGGTKTMTKINAEGRAWGTGKIWPGRRSGLILPVRVIIQLGFKSMTPEGSKLPTLRTGLFQRMMQVQCFLQVFQVGSLVTFCRAYIPVTGFVLYRSDIFVFKPEGYYTLPDLLQVFYLRIDQL
jgi:hypothetical protein